MPQFQKAEHEKTGVTDFLIRLSVGIEDISNLLKDLEQALAKIKSSIYYLI